MKVKAVIWRPDRTNDVIVVSKKDQQAKTFRHDNETYFIHPDRFMVTWTRPGWAFGLMRRYYSTFYYVKGNPQPVPVPDMKGVAIAKASLEKRLRGEKGPPTVDTSDGFRAVVNDGISGEELAAIFNPWFYRIIAAQTLTVWDQVQLWASLGACVGIVYVIYCLTTGNYSLPKGP